VQIHSTFTELSPTDTRSYIRTIVFLRLEPPSIFRWMV